MKKILVVDDEVEVGRAIGTILRHFGFEVCSVNSAAKALQCLGEFEPDLFLIDSFMPKTSGHQLAERIKSLSGHQNTPILLLTILETKFHLRNDIFVGVLQKPVAAEQLLRAVEQAMDPKSS